MIANKKFLTALTVLLTCVGSLFATVPEPSTLLYGKVLHRTFGNEHQLFEGNLTWTLRDESGQEFTYATNLENISDTFSYKVSIPHQALSSGLSVDPDVIPLAVGESTYEFVSIEVDGYPAAILWSEVDFLSILQGSRAATHRIDLVVSFDLTDTDGDGMPDWWEKFYGLDWQIPDADLDPDGDGWLNSEEYYNGTDPFNDDRAPSVQTLNLAAYGESASGVWLRSVDADSSAGELSYTLTALPQGGTLQFMPSSGISYILSIGDEFTQVDLNQGRVTYHHDTPSVIETSFSLSLSDGSYTPFEADVMIDVFPPDPAGVEASTTSSIPAWWRDENVVFEAYWGLRENVISGQLVESALLYLLGKNYGWTLWDQRLQTLPVVLSVNTAGSHFILGGAADDVLRGGSEGDILSGGPGSDILAGGLGVDLFMVGDEGLERIEDFEPSADILDLSDLVLGQTGLLDTFLSVDYNGTDSTIRVDRNGDASGYTDAEIRLEGIELVQDDLHRLWSLGQLLLGTIQGKPSVTIEGWPTESLEEGYSTAELVLRRNGPASGSLSVSLAISGSATNGSDYTTLPTTAQFADGESSLVLLVDPLFDGAAEFIEQLNLSVEAGSGYVLGSDVSGQIMIVDAKQRFSINAIQASTVVGGDPAYLQILRDGPRNGFVQLLLGIGGSGVSGADFTPLPTLVSFTDQQGSLYLPVEALAGGSLAVGESSETVSVTIKPAFADEYSLGMNTTATIRLLSNLEAFESWLAESMPEADTTLSTSELSTLDSPRTGFDALLEYALSYGLNLDDGVDAEERSRLVPQIFFTENGPHFEFTQRLNDDRLEYIVECSPDLINWDSGPDRFERVPLNEDLENSGRVRYRVVGPGSEQQCFIRVRIEITQ